jgi:hypothetical protein
MTWVNKLGNNARLSNYTLIIEGPGSSWQLELFRSAAKEFQQPLGDLNHVLQEDETFVWEIITNCRNIIVDGSSCTYTL